MTLFEVSVISLTLVHERVERRKCRGNDGESLHAPRCFTNELHGVQLAPFIKEEIQK